MTTRTFNTLLAALAVALAVTLVVRSRQHDQDAIAAYVEGDVVDDFARHASAALPDQARAFLATDRPWRAAMVMREYLRAADTVPADHLVLAARAEAGWGAWPEVLALLDRTASLDAHESGVGLYLLGRARDETGDAAGAVEAYRAFLALSAPGGELASERDAARLRLGLALIRAGDRAAAGRELVAVSRDMGGASVWLELLEADALAHTGDTAAVRAATARFDGGYQGLRAWRARVQAARSAGDIAAARSLANRARAWASTDATRAEFLVAAGRAAVEMGDVGAGRDAFRSAIARAVGTPHAREAAHLLQQGDMSPDDHLAVSRVLRAQGLHDEAVDGFRRWLAAGGGTVAQRAEVQMELANALFYAQRYDEVADALRPVATTTPARMLRARTEANRGNTDEAARLYLAIADQFPRSTTGAQALYLAASARHDGGDPRRARELYRRIVAEYPGSSQMGLAMMRLGGIAFLDGEHAEAARQFEQYRSRYPRGSHILQATYWAGRAREAAGDTGAAAALYRDVIQRERDSYYAMRASERLREQFWPLPMAAAPADEPAAARRVADWMRGVDLLRGAGFAEEASAEADRLVSAAGSDRPTLYALAEALAERGYSQRAIRLAMRLQGGGRPDRRLMRVLFPFPYRTLITEEARARGIEPATAAALIRQESMFEVRATSPAGARGLMQIMPPTGRHLAAAVALEPWDAELLYHPEINVHLGTRYLAQHMATYAGSLPAVFSAYNAGTHRIDAWRAFREFGDEELFTERIPFAETRGYVRILTRNQAVYRGLYGD